MSFDPNDPLFGEYFVESADSIAPVNFGTSLQGGKATLNYILTPNVSIDLYDQDPDLYAIQVTNDLCTMISYHLGGVHTGVIDGSLNRYLPVAHPQYPWLYCSNVSQIRGESPSKPESRVAASTILTGLKINTLPFYTLYDQYRVTTEWTPRPYAILPNSEITVTKGTYFDINGAQQNYSYANEWNRYADLLVIPLALEQSSLTIQRGQMSFITSDGSPPDRTPFAAMPRMPLPDYQVAIKWYNIPYRYVSSPNSFLTKWKGFINQHPFTFRNITFKPGSLRYDGYTVDGRYTPPIPETDIDDPGIISTDKWCDVTLIFGWTVRELTKPPVPNNASLTNPNFIAGGWNASPWIGTLRGFFYAQTVPSTINAKNPPPPSPLWPSGPVPEILFTDPDFVPS